MSEFKIPKISVSTESLFSILEAIAVRPSLRIEDHSAYSGLSESTTRRCITILQELDLVDYNDKKGYYYTGDSLARDVPLQHKKAVIQKALIAYRPFEVFCEGLAYGESSDESFRKTASLLDLESADTKTHDFLIDIGIKFEILEFDSESEISIKKIDTISINKIPNLINPEDILSEVSARLYLAKRLGREPFNFLDEKERQLLASGLVDFPSNPQQSIDKVGQALENFLREIAFDNNLGKEAQKKNGITQLATFLYTENVIHVHHMNIAQASGTIRNAEAHNKDKKTMTPWQFSNTGAFLSINLALVLIKSIFEYIYKARQLI